MSVVSALALLHERLGALESCMGVVYGSLEYLPDRESGVVNRGAERYLRTINFKLHKIFVREVDEFRREMIANLPNGKNLRFLSSFERPFDQIRICLKSTQNTNEAVLYLRYNFNSEPYVYFLLLTVEGLMTGDPPTFHETTPADYAPPPAGGFEHFQIGHASQFTLATNFVDDQNLENSTDYADRGDGSKFQTAYQLVYIDAPRTPRENERTFYTPAYPADSETMRRRFYWGDAKQMRFFWSLMRKLILHL